MGFTEHFGHSLNQGIAEFTDKFIKLSIIKIIMIPFDLAFYSFCSFSLNFKLNKTKDWALVHERQWEK